MEQKVIMQWDACGVSDEAIRKWFSRVAHEVNRIKMVLEEDHVYRTAYASLALPYDDQLLNAVISMIERVKRYNPTLCIVVGIGGSSLGTRAVYEALNGILGNDISDEVRLYFAETIDSDYMVSLEQLIHREIERGGSVVLNVTSKSGRTTETIVNFEYFLSVLRSCYPDEYVGRIVITTEYDSPLAECAVERHIAVLDIPQHVGGRYSVFSAVGLFPLGLAGANLNELRLGAQKACKDGLQIECERNFAIRNACIMYAHYQTGIHINDMFLFSTALQSVGAWWRQLVGESLGKQVQGEADERVGIVPTVSVGSTDLHSVAQLYLGGPEKMLTTFVTVAHANHNIALNRPLLCKQLVANIQDKQVSFIMSAIIHGTLQAYEQNNNPFTVVTLAYKKEYEIGYFLQTKMLEIIYLAFLLNVNPFDQPDIERYKRNTREILAHE